MTAASDGVCIGRRIDLAAAACAARSTSAVRSPRAYPSAFRAAAAATSALDTGVPRASAIVLTTAPRASAASGIRSSHAWSSRPAARTASWRDSGDVAVANNATRRPRRKSATSAMTSPTISPGPPPGASAPPPPRAAAAATARDGVQVVEYHDGGRASGRRRRRRLHRGNSRPRVAGCGVGHRPARDVDDRRERALVVAEGPGDAPRDAAAPASRCAPEEDAARNITPGDRRQRRRESRRRLIRRLIRR